MAGLAITFTDVSFSRENPQDRFDLTLGVEATLTLSVGERIIYREHMFPIVELRQALASWTPDANKDFEFISMESDEPGLIWLRQQPSGLWRAGSIDQDDIAAQELDSAQIVDGCAEFVARVDCWVRDELLVEVSDVLRD